MRSGRHRRRCAIARRVSLVVGAVAVAAQSPSPRPVDRASMLPRGRRAHEPGPRGIRRRAARPSRSSTAWDGRRVRGRRRPRLLLAIRRRASLTAAYEALRDQSAIDAGCRTRLRDRVRQRALRRRGRAGRWTRALPSDERCLHQRLDARRRDDPRRASCSSPTPASPTLASTWSGAPLERDDGPRRHRRAAAPRPIGGPDGIAHARHSRALLRVSRPTAPVGRGAAPPVGELGDRELHVRPTVERGQATGEPDTTEYGDYATAWAPAGADVGPQWIELGYDVAVTPDRGRHLGVVGRRASSRSSRRSTSHGRLGHAVGRLRRLAGVRRRVQPAAPDERRVTDRLRVTIDTDVPGWNEIDAVGLFGVPADPADRGSACRRAAVGARPRGATSRRR